jgi:ABC-2 type transport system ATP-binding protein
MAAIELQALTKRFGSIEAIRDITLQIEYGEVFGFLGPNGAGKSTTINILLDFVRRTSGEVSVLGYDPESNPRAVRERLGVLPEASGFYKRDTALDHLHFAIAMTRADDDAHELLDRVNLSDAAERPVGEFSAGMRQRLGLAIALVGKPDLLILDEPLGGLDPDGARILRGIVRKECGRGAAVFFSSHIMDQVEAICDRVGIMNAGELVAVDRVDSLLAQTEVSTTLILAVEEIPAEADVHLEGIDGVEQVTVRDGTVRLTCNDSRAKAAAVAQMDAMGITITDITTDGTALEQIFTSITTGRDA